MSKAILVVDMPKSCADCTFRTSLNEDHLYCCATLPRINIDPMTVKHIKEHKCPLKPMPEKKEVEVNKIEDIMQTGYSIEDIYTNKYVATIRLATDKLISLGWNACLEEIEK